MYTLHKECRACGYGKQPPSGTKAEGPKECLLPLLNLGLQPLANDFLKSGQEHAGFAPLELLVCPSCGLAQLSVVVRPEILYSCYAYETSRSETMQQHFAALWEEIGRHVNPMKVLEIGSNDGYFLKFCRQHGAEFVLGIDPAHNLVERAILAGVPTMDRSFTTLLAVTLAALIPQPDVIVARHVFNHVDNWRDFITALGVVAGDNTLIVIEVPDVTQMVKYIEFDTIYHEHLSYLGIGSLRRLLEPSRLMLWRAVPFPIHGGSMAFLLRTKREQHPVSDVALEDITVDEWRRFSNEVNGQIVGLQKKLRELKSLGKRVAGYGASAKSTVWINACRLTKNELSFICDSTKAKWFTTSPGSDIPIVDEGALLRELPDYAVNFAWNFAEEIERKNQAWMEKGGQFILPHRAWKTTATL